MGFLDKVKDVGKSALKTVVLAANDWCGQVIEVEYGDMDLKKCLVSTDSQGKALVFYKGVTEVGRIPTSELGTYEVEAIINSVSAVTRIYLKNDESKYVTIKTKFNDGSPSSSTTKIPGVYLDTRGDTYMRFVDFLNTNTDGPTDEAKRQIALIVDLVEKIKKIYKK